MLDSEMWRRRPDLACALYGLIARTRRDEMPPGRGSGINFWSLKHCKGCLAINYLRTHIDMSQRHLDAMRFRKGSI